MHTDCIHTTASLLPKSSSNSSNSSYFNLCMHECMFMKHSYLTDTCIFIHCCMYVCMYVCMNVKKRDQGSKSGKEISEVSWLPKKLRHTTDLMKGLVFSDPINQGRFNNYHFLWHCWAGKPLTTNHLGKAWGNNLAHTQSNSHAYKYTPTHTLSLSVSSSLQFNLYAKNDLLVCLHEVVGHASVPRSLSSRE